MSGRFVTACRIHGCRQIAVVPSSLCYDHIERGKAATGLYLGYRLEMDGRWWINLYVLEGGPFVKIGVSNGIEARMAILQTGCPYELAMKGHMPVPRRIEAMVHGALEEYRSNGEWFRYEGAVIDVTAAICRKDYEWLGGYLGLRVPEVPAHVFALSGADESDNLSIGPLP